MEDEPTRRWVLSGTAGAAALLAGCGSSDGGDGSTEADSADGDGSASTDEPTATAPSTPPTPDIEAWQFIDGDAGASSAIGGSVPAADPEVVWSQGDDFNSRPIILPVFNEELVLLAFVRRKTLQFVDHQGNLAFEQEFPPREKYAQADGFLIETPGGPVVKVTNDGERAWSRGTGRSQQFEPHPEPDVLSYRRSFTDDDGTKTGEVGVYDLAAEAYRWRKSFPLERPHGGSDRPVEYRPDDILIDTEHGALVHGVLLAENPPDGEHHGELVARDLSTGAVRWRVDGVNRKLANISGGNVLSAGISWAGDASEPVSQYLRSYHVSAVDGGADTTVAEMGDGSGTDLFVNSGLAFDDHHYYLDGETLFATTPDNTTLVALAAPDGEEHWANEAAGTVQCPPRFASNAIVLGTTAGLELVGRDGETLTTVDVDTSFAGGIMLTPGRIYAAGKSLYAIQ